MSKPSDTAMSNLKRLVGEFWATASSLRRASAREADAPSSDPTKSTHRGDSPTSKSPLSAAQLVKLLPLRRRPRRFPCLVVLRAAGPKGVAPRIHWRPVVGNARGAHARADP